MNEVPGITPPEYTLTGEPLSLVRRFGAKSGILLYCQDKLPHIPQARMNAYDTNVGTDKAIGRAVDAGLTLPWLVRSSSEEELKPGSEGKYASLKVRNLTEAVYIVDAVRHPIQGKIPFNIAELARHQYLGTMVPYQDGFLTTLTDTDDLKSVYYICEGKVMFLWQFSHSSTHDNGQIHDRLLEVTSWPGQIEDLPGMDGRFSGQMEYGLTADINLLYQFRPFINRKKSDFTLEDPQFAFPDTLVFGQTAKEGVVGRLVKPGFNPGTLNLGDTPVVYYGNLRDGVPDIPTPFIWLAKNPVGILMHKDVGPIRRSMVSILSYGDLRSLEKSSGEGHEQVKVVADGNGASIELLQADDMDEKRRIALFELREEVFNEVIPTLWDALANILEFDGQNSIREVRVNISGEDFWTQVIDRENRLMIIIKLDNNDFRKATLTRQSIRSAESRTEEVYLINNPYVEEIVSASSKARRMYSAKEIEEIGINSRAYYLGFTMDLLRMPDIETAVFIADSTY